MGEIEIPHNDSVNMGTVGLTVSGEQWQPGVTIPEPFNIGDTSESRISRKKPVRGGAEFLDKSSKTIDILPVFFEPQWSSSGEVDWWVVHSEKKKIWSIAFEGVWNILFEAQVETNNGPLSFLIIVISFLSTIILYLTVASLSTITIKLLIPPVYPITISRSHGLNCRECWILTPRRRIMWVGRSVYNCITWRGGGVHRITWGNCQFPFAIIHDWPPPPPQPAFDEVEAQSAYDQRSVDGLPEYHHHETHSTISSLHSLANSMEHLPHDDLTHVGMIPLYRVHAGRSLPQFPKWCNIFLGLIEN